MRTGPKKERKKAGDNRGEAEASASLQSCDANSDTGQLFCSCEQPFYPYCLYISPQHCCCGEPHIFPLNTTDWTLSGWPAASVFSCSVVLARMLFCHISPFFLLMDYCSTTSTYSSGLNRSGRSSLTQRSPPPRIPGLTCSCFTLTC